MPLNVQLSLGYWFCHINIFDAYVIIKNVLNASLNKDTNTSLALHNGCQAC